MEALRRAVEPAFLRRTPFKSGDVADEYYFDCAAYCAFRVREGRGWGWMGEGDQAAWPCCWRWCGCTS